MAPISRCRPLSKASALTELTALTLALRTCLFQATSSLATYTRCALQVTFLPLSLTNLPLNSARKPSSPFLLRVRSNISLRLLIVTPTQQMKATMITSPKLKSSIKLVCGQMLSISTTTVRIMVTLIPSSMKLKFHSSVLPLVPQPGLSSASSVIYNPSPRLLTRMLV